MLVDECAQGACWRLFSFRRKLVERYGGSAAGALASLVGRTALGREGLAREDAR